MTDDAHLDAEAAEDDGLEVTDVTDGDTDAEGGQGAGESRDVADARRTERGLVLRDLEVGAAAAMRSSQL